MPLFTRTNLSELRRFITLIDTLYDHKIRIACSAAAEPEKLFQLGEEKVELSDSQRVLMDDLQVKAGEEASQANVFSGAEETFAFERTVSRLKEMQTQNYWNRIQK